MRRGMLPWHYGDRGEMEENEEKKGWTMRWRRGEREGRRKALASVDAEATGG
jgi:hypothetical protein